MDDCETQCEQFYIFNPSFCRREGEEAEKIVYFYPHTTDLNLQVKAVGLSEAVAHFTKQFGDSPVRCLSTQKSRQVFLEPEPGFWLVMRFAVPCQQRKQQQEAGVSGDELDYLPETVQDTVCQALLQHAYDMYVLFKGPLQLTIDRSNVQVLKQKCSHFFTRYLTDPNHSCFTIYKATLLDLYRGISFLPLSKRAFLQAHCLVQRVESAFPLIKYSMFLVGEQLVWTSLQPKDARCVYAYLLHSLFPRHAEDELRNLDKGVSSSAAFGRFITGPPNLEDRSDLGTVPRVFLQHEQHQQPLECHMIVYRYARSSLCLFVDANEQAATFDLFVQLERMLAPLMRQVCDHVSTSLPDIQLHQQQQQQQQQLQASNESHIRFLYYNHMNLAQKNTVFVQLDGNKRPGVLAVNRSLMRLCSDVHTDHCRSGEFNHTETVVKTFTDDWLVAKKFDSRDFFALITQQKPNNLILVTDEVSRLCQAQFHTILFIE